MRGTIIEVKQEPSFQTPTHSADSKNHSNRLANEWDGRGSNPSYESSSVREARSTGNLFDGSPVPRRRVQSSEHPNNGNQSSFHPRNQHQGEVGVRFNGYHDSEYSGSDGYYEDRQQRTLPEKRYGERGSAERGSAELTPDSGISTTSDSDRLRRAMSDRKRTLAKRQLSRQEGMEDELYDHRGGQSRSQGRSQGQGHGHGHGQYDDYDNYNVDELEEELLSQAAYANARFDEEEEEEKLKQQKQKQKSKFKEVALISDMPPGHVRTFDGKFPARCSIRYLPKSCSRDEDWTDPDLDAEGALAVQSGKVVCEYKKQIVNTKFAVMFQWKYVLKIFFKFVLELSDAFVVTK